MEAKSVDQSILKEEFIMSEQEKAIPMEGTITTAEEQSWLKKKIEKHPVAWKWAKRIAAGLGVGTSMFAAFQMGKTAGNSKSEENLTDEDESDEDESENDVA